MDSDLKKCLKLEHKTKRVSFALLHSSIDQSINHSSGKISFSQQLTGLFDPKKVSLDQLNALQTTAPQWMTFDLSVTLWSEVSSAVTLTQS